MSRIGKQPVIIPQGVAVSFENGTLRVRGPKGELTRQLNEKLIQVNIGEKEIAIQPKKITLESKMLWGTYVSHIRNMVQGVTEGFEKKLEIEGIGYRALMKGNTLVLYVGFSHPVEVESKPGIQFQVEKNVITVAGTDKERVGEVASHIRSFRKPEPYKGKGIHYLGEVIRRKAGKKAATTAGA